MIFLILLFAFLVRLIGLNQSLWLDEAIGAIFTKNLSYGDLLTNFLRSDNHPPLYYLVLKLWSSIFGYSEISLRMPSVLFAIGTIYVIYLIAKSLSKNKYTPYVVALLLSFSSFFIYYSQEARMYSMAAFLASLAFYAYIKLLERSNNRSWVVFCLSITALIFTDYMPIFLFPVFWIWTAVTKRKNRDWIKKFLLCHLPLVGFGILWLPIFLSQREGSAWLLKTMVGWKSIAGGATIKETVLVWSKFVFGRISLDSKKIYYFLVFVSSVPVAISLLRTIVKEKLRIFWFWVLTPLILGFLASFAFPAFIYFRYLYIVPAFYLLVVFGVFSFKNKSISVVLLLSIIFFNIVSLAIYFTDPRQQREMWREATAFVEEKGSRDSVVVFEYPDAFTPYRWYAKGNIKAVGVLDSIAVQDKKKVDQLVDSATSGKREVYHFEYLRDLSDPGRVVEERLRQDGFVPKDEYGSFYGVGKITRWVKQ